MRYTKEHVDRLSKILKGVIDGKQLQWLDKAGAWRDSTRAIYLLNLCDVVKEEYRLKPEPKYRPFTPVEAAEFLGKKFIFHNKNYTILFVASDGVLTTREVNFSYEELLKDCKFNDGTTCGVLVEE